MALLTLKGEQIYLRALEPEDMNMVMEIENNEDFWEISSTLTPYSKYLIKQYLENSHRDIYDVKQLRLAICTYDYNRVIGLIDLFDYDPKNNRAGIGILILDTADRGRGYGAEALKLIAAYSFTHLDMHQLYANILEENKQSVKLFENQGFTKVGVKRDWRYFGGTYKNELLYQLLATDVH